MAFVLSTPAGLIALFSLGIQAVIGLVLAFSTGLSALHKDLLVGFVMGFPSLAFLIVLVLLARGQHNPMTAAEAGVTSPAES